MLLLPQPGQAGGGLSLHTFQTLMKGGNNGPPLVPGNSDESRMIQMVEGLLEPIMPEDGFLEDQDIEALRAWVDAGAPPWQGDLGRMRLERLPDIRPTETVRPEVASLAFHPQGTMVAAGSYEEIRLLRPGGGVDARLTGLAETVRSVAFSPDGSRLASGAGMPSRFGEIKIWDPATRQLVRSWEGHTDCIYSVAFSPDGSVLATASYDRLVKLWEVTTGREIRTISGHVDAVYSLAFNASGDRLASASADRTVKVWDVASGRQLGTPLSGATAELFAMAFYPGGRRIAAAGMDKMIRIWDLDEEGGILAGFGLFPRRTGRRPLPDTGREHPDFGRSRRTGQILGRGLPGGEKGPASPARHGSGAGRQPLRRDFGRGPL